MMSLRRVSALSLQNKGKEVEVNVPDAYYQTNLLWGLIPDTCMETCPDTNTLLAKTHINENRT